MERNEQFHLNETMLIDESLAIKDSSLHPYLVIFDGKETGVRYKLKPGDMTVGRSPKADIRIDDHGISRIHCSVKWAYDTIIIEDKGSKNGTYIDSKKIICASLPTGVPLQIGQSVLKIEYKDEAEIQIEEKLKHRATFDALTGIFNRYHFMKIAIKEIAYACEHHQTAAIIMIDIDNFKRINDSYGHKVGDLVLSQVTDVIQNKIEADYLFGRYGGEEFIILPPRETEKEAIFNRCERIRKAIESFEFSHSDVYLRSTISIGYHLDRLNIDDAELILIDLIDKADQALYLAKNNGKNRVETFI